MESERSDGGAAGQLRCPMAGPAGGCTARPYSDHAIARGTDVEIFQLYLDRKLRVAEQDIFERAQQQVERQRVAANTPNAAADAEALFAEQLHPSWAAKQQSQSQVRPR